MWRVDRRDPTHQPIQSVAGVSTWAKGGGDASSIGREWEEKLEINIPNRSASRSASQLKVWWTGATQCGREAGRGRRSIRGMRILSEGTGRRFGSSGIRSSAVCGPIGGEENDSHECIASGIPPSVVRSRGRAISPLEYRRTVQIALRSVWRAGISTSDRVAAPSAAKVAILTNATLRLSKGGAGSLLGDQRITL